MTSRLMCVLSLMLSALLLATAPSARAAQTGGAGVSWQELSPEQQQLLANFESRWADLPLARQQSLAKGSQRWLTMPPEQRQLIAVERHRRSLRGRHPTRPRRPGLPLRGSVRRPGRDLRRH